MECPSENSFQKSCREWGGGWEQRERQAGSTVNSLSSRLDRRPRAQRCPIGGDQVTVTELRQHTPLTASVIPEQKGITDKNKYSFLQSSLPENVEKAKTNCYCSSGVTRRVQEQNHPVPTTLFFPKYLPLASLNICHCRQHKDSGAERPFASTCVADSLYWLSLG